MTERNKQRLAALLACVFLGAPAPLAQTSGQPIRVAILVYDGVYNTEFIAPLDVFNHAETLTRGRIQVFTVAPSTGPVTTAEGLRILPQYSFANAPAVDWLILPSGANYHADIQNKALVGWIRDTGKRSQVVHSNCWGAFLLGAAGLLDGKQATTFPPSLEEFAQRFPAITVRRDAQLVDDRGALTSAGGVVSYDAALYLVEKQLGLELARRIAGGLVLDWDARRSLYASARAASTGIHPPRK